MCILFDDLSECEYLNLTVSIFAHLPEHVDITLRPLGFVIVMGMNVGRLYILSFCFTLAAILYSVVYRS